MITATADRRSFLLTAGVTVAAAAIGEVAGRSFATRKNVSAAQAAVRFPRAAVPAPQLPAGVNLPVPGISPFITPNGQFYRVDTALIIPQVDPTGWQLRIHGMVAREITMSFDQLLHRPLIEDYITLTCVSNPVGGPLRRERQVARGVAVVADPRGRAAARGGAAVLHLGGRVHLGGAAGDGARRRAGLAGGGGR